jgi:hypothetical protein
MTILANAFRWEHPLFVANMDVDFDFELPGVARHNLLRLCFKSMRVQGWYMQRAIGKRESIVREP